MRKIKKFLLKKVSKYLNITIYRLLPFGIDPLHDIIWKIKGYRLEIVFDVGANTGQSINYFLEKHPNCQIFAFEPSQSCFTSLKHKFKKLRNIVLFNYAIGNKNGVAFFADRDDSDFSSIVFQKTADFHGSIYKVQIKKLDTICNELGINGISYLKIDTEGYDLEVLYSASNLLSKGAIDFIQVEAGMNPFNTNHVPIEKFVDYLHKYNYFRFGYYDQILDWKNKKMILRRSNALFVSARVLDSYNLF
jgi:FkbM family methyltransferase